MIHAVVHPAIERPMTAKYILSYRDKAKSMGFSHIDLPINNAIRVCVSVDIDELFIDKLIKMQAQTEVIRPYNTQFLGFLSQQEPIVSWSFSIPFTEK